MKKVTYEIVRKYQHYDPQFMIYMPIDYADTPVNFIKEYGHQLEQRYDIARILLTTDFLNESQLRLFAVDNAKSLNVD